jgi:hypothetical protein
MSRSDCATRNALGTINGRTSLNFAAPMLSTDLRGAGLVALMIGDGRWCKISEVHKVSLVSISSFIPLIS